METRRIVGRMCYEGLMGFLIKVGVLPAPEEPPAPGGRKACTRRSPCEKVFLPYIVPVITARLMAKRW